MSRGAYGYVYLDLADRRRMAQLLGLPTGTFTRKYCDKTNGWFHLKDPEKDCLFLDGKRCSVYEARPTQCRTWPFWPENMDAKVWQEEVASFCPGIGKGKRFSLDDIADVLEKKVDVSGDRFSV